jgi:GH15 family glucan-1,4-alpha-glucosidase
VPDDLAAAALLKSRLERSVGACLTFEKMATYANHLELFAEQIGPTGEQLGNFPQAFTHLALINATISLDDLLNCSERVGDLAHVGVGQAHI